MLPPSPPLRSIALWSLLSLLTAGNLVVANDPYETRQDREYRSLAAATTRAQSGSSSTYRAPEYPSYSSAGNARSNSVYDYASSVSPSSTLQEKLEAYVEILNLRAEQSAAREAEAKVRAALAQQWAVGDEVTWARIHRANARAALEQWRDSPVFTVNQWEELTRQTGGKMPLRRPTNGHYETPRAEFLHVSSVGKLEGPKAPWENLRAGQMCLRYEGDEAEPERAFAFFAHSDPDWPEVQLGMGLCYLRGLGVAKDTARGVALLEKAAQSGAFEDEPAAFFGRSSPFTVSYEAARELGISYDLGRFLPADPTRALYWYWRAGQHRLYPGEAAELKALKHAFWSKHQAEAVDLLRAEYATNAATTTTSDAAAVHAVDDTLLDALGTLQDGDQLYAAGAFVDTRSRNGQALIRGRSGMSYFLAAARLGNEAAARAFFSPAENGYFSEDLDGHPVWSEHADFVRENWPQLEARWQAAVAAGDLAASLPLAFHYSGIRGNRAAPELAERYLALLPADLPAPQREAVERAVRSIDARDVQDWESTVWAAFKADSQSINLAALTVAPDAAQARTLRENGNRLALIDPKLARNFWRDAAALGDLPAQVRLYGYTKSNGIWLQSAYERSLRARLESAAASGDFGAIASLSLLLDGRPTNRLALGSARYEDGQRWLATALEQAPAKARYQALANASATTDADYAAALADAQRETETWRAIAATWGLEGYAVIAQATLSDEEFTQLASRRRELLALATAAETIAQLLPAWENSLEPIAYDPVADARFVLGYEAWFGFGDDDESRLKNPVLALDYLTQSTQLGHPLAPLALAYYCGSGYAGFPRDPALADRLRTLADLRLTIMAANGDTWAQTMLGDLLVTGDNRRDDDPERPAAFEWLPRDDARGLRWLEIAALEGATLPANFADATGQFVSRRIAWYFYNAGNPTENARWQLITSIIELVAYSDEPQRVDWEEVLNEARAIVTDTPETARLAVLDQAIDAADNAETEDAALSLRLFSARAEARLALGWTRAASLDAEAATRSGPTDPAPWLLLARIQKTLRDTQNAEISAATARVVAADPGGFAAFEHAMAQASPAAVERYLSRIAQCQYFNPDSVVLADLRARAETFLPADGSP